ncbi:hypothetical protein [Stutzerimonas xanthomarina]|uniref:hypothetical protein n=1 Tax=Stutzerimonas xanthomarina TaxID=271420 RepID=UPI003AA86F2E
MSLTFNDAIESEMTAEEIAEEQAALAAEEEEKAEAELLAEKEELDSPLDPEDQEGWDDQILNQ